MLKFGSNEISWSDVVSFSLNKEEVSVTTTDNVTLVLGIFPTVSNAAKVYEACVANKAASTVGGVLIEVIIDDL